MPLEFKGFRHGAVAIPIVAIAGIVTVGAGKQGRLREQRNVANYGTDRLAWQPTCRPPPQFLYVTVSATLLQRLHENVRADDRDDHGRLHGAIDSQRQASLKA
jgi:hypothetical protein